MNLPIYEVTSKFRKPVLITHGKRDEVVSIEGVMEYRKHLADCQVKLYDDLKHGLQGGSHQEMYVDVLEFLRNGTHAGN